MVIQVKNEQNIPFNVVLVNDSESIVKIYDARYSFTEFGQFVSSYYMSTFCGIKEECGLCLHGSEPNWVLSANNVNTIKNFIKSEIFI
jgi:hypothetical protein